MIRTFEELFAKMKADGKNWIPLHMMHQDYQYWHQEMKETSGGPQATAHRLKDKSAENLVGYLSCLRDMNYISESEYGWLWGSLNLI